MDFLPFDVGPAIAQRRDRRLPSVPLFARGWRAAPQDMKQ